MSKGKNKCKVLGMPYERNRKKVSAADELKE